MTPSRDWPDPEIYVGATSGLLTVVARSHSIVRADGVTVRGVLAKCKCDRRVVVQMCHFTKLYSCGCWTRREAKAARAAAAMERISHGVAI